MARRSLVVILLLMSFGHRGLACSLVAGAEDPTPGTMRMAMGVLLLALFVSGIHLAVFIYRNGRNGWIFWITLALSLIIVPISLFLIMMLGGTACGQGTIEIAGFLFAFQLIALMIQLFSWTDPGNTYGPIVPRD